MQLWPNMPLAVVNEDDHAYKAEAIFWQGRNLDFKYIGNVATGRFWTSQNPHHLTALVTTGAASCLIIVVHCTDGRGALGHYAADKSPAAILLALEKMLTALAGTVVDTILFAAGIGGADMRHQLMYEMQIVARTRQLVPGARVMWPPQDPANNWCCAIYLPLTAQLALFHDFPDSIKGRTGAGNGLDPRGY